MVGGFREREGADVAFEESDGGVGGDVGGFGAEGLGVAGEDGGFSVEGEGAVGVEEGFEEPVAEEAGYAGEEDAFVGNFGPEITSMGENVVEVFWGQGAGGHQAFPFR